MLDQQEQHANYSFITNASANGVEQPEPLRSAVTKAIKHYLTALDGQDVTDVYELVLSELEAPLLEQVMTYTRGNQTKAAIMLGINRGTLRKKLKLYGIN